MWSYTSSSMMVCVTRFRFILYCLLFPLWCVAIEPYTPVKSDPIQEPWRWRHEEALANLGALCMDEAQDGTLWFGNIGSLAHYDGTTVTTFPFEEDLLRQIEYEKEIPWVKALLVLPNENLLVLIGNSLALRMADGRWQVLVSDTGDSVFSAQLVKSNNGTAFLLVPDGLWEIDLSKLSCSQILKPEGTGKWQAFCQDKNGTIWLVEKMDASSLLLCFSDRDKEPAFYPIPFSTNPSEEKITADPSGRIWYVNNSDQIGFRAFDPVKKVWNEPDDNEPANNASILPRENGFILAAGLGEILSVSPGNKTSHYSASQLDLPLVPFSLTETSGNRLWLIGRIGYVYSVDLSDREWKTFAGLNFQCETPNGTQWFTSYPFRYTISFDPQTGEWHRYGTEDHGLDKVFALLHSSHGLIWAAGSCDRQAAISVFDGTGWTRLSIPEFAERIEHNSAFEAQDGTVWFGAGGAHLDRPETGGALQFQVNPDRSVSLKHHYAFPDFPYYVTAFAQTPDQTLWIGSTIIHRFDGSSTQAQPVHGLSGENTSAMAVLPDGTLWAAKEHLGACRWNRNSWDIFSLRDGIISLRTADLLTLKDGSILLSTDKGICRYDGTTWLPNAYPEIFSMTTRYSGLRQTGDGAIWLNYSIFDRHMLPMSPDLRGFCAIRHIPEKAPPDTQISTFLEKVSQPGNTRIEWSGRDALNQTPQSKLLYSWRLDAGAWSPFSSETGKTFLGLKIGPHMLEVRARDRALNVDPVPASAEFRVIPPVWRQGWFITLISSLLGLIVFLLRRLILAREQRLIEQQEQREAFLIRQRKEREAELRGELVSLHESFRRLEDQLKQTRKPFIQPDEPENESDREFLNQITTVLDQHYFDWEFGREDLAKAVHMSLRTFQRRLKAVSGHTPKELIREFRLSRAAELLAYTSLSITDIAFKTGHDDSGNFARIFKKYFDVTPTQYRAEHSSG